MLDQSFLIAAILVVIAILFYTLYWNRLLALIFSVILRVILWNKDGSSVWIQIGALSFTYLLSPSDVCPDSRLAPHVILVGANTSQGFPIPLEQPIHQSRQSPVAVAILDSFPHHLRAHSSPRRRRRVKTCAA